MKKETKKPDLFPLSKVGFALLQPFYNLIPINVPYFKIYSLLTLTSKCFSKNIQGKEKTFSLFSFLMNDMNSSIFKYFNRLIAFHKIKTQKTFTFQQILLPIIKVFFIYQQSIKIYFLTFN